MLINILKMTKGQKWPNDTQLYVEIVFCKELFTKFDINLNGNIKNNLLFYYGYKWDTKLFIKLNDTFLYQKTLYSLKCNDTSNWEPLD